MASSSWDPWSYREAARWRGEPSADASGPGTAGGAHAEERLTPEELTSDIEGGLGSGTADPSVTGGSPVAGGRELRGFTVQATDGDVGKVDVATEDVGASYLVVDTGPWILGRKVLLPAGTVERVDWDETCVHVDRTKQQIKDSPELTDADLAALADPDRRQLFGEYYTATYTGGAPAPTAREEERQGATQDWDPWTYPDTLGVRPGGDIDDVMSDATGRQSDLIGFGVEATDGSIGKVDAATDEVGSSYLVVDTGPWIFGRKVVLPGGIVERVDWDDETIHVGRTKDEIKDSPELDETSLEDLTSRESLGTYYRNYHSSTL